MRTHRVARLVAILLFLVALVYFCGGMAVGLPLWSRGLGEGWGSGFSGWLAIPILAGTLFGAIILLIFGAILYFLARIDTNLTTARQNPPVSALRPVAAGAALASETAPSVPPEAAPAAAEPIMVGSAAAAIVDATRDEAPPSAVEVGAAAPAASATAGLGAAATAVVAGVAVAGVAAAAAHEDEVTPAETETASEVKVETVTSSEPAKAALGTAATAAVAGAVVAVVAVIAAHEDKATPAETEATAAAGPQVEIGPLETPEPEAKPLSPEPIVPAVATAMAFVAIADTQPEWDAEVETPAVAAVTEQAFQPSVEPSAAVAEAPSPAADEVETSAVTAPEVVAPAVAAPKAEGAAAKMSGLDALLIGLGRLALGKQPDKPVEAQPPMPKTEASVAAVAATEETLTAPDLEAELPADADAAPQEFTGKLPGADDAARIASEMSGGDSGKPEATK